MTNNMNQNQRKAIETALVQMKAARGNLLLVVILTAINIVMFASGSDNMFLFSATIPYSIAVAGMLTETVQISVIGIVFALLILALYLVCWGMSKHHYGWMIAALVIFSIDTVAWAGICILVGDISGIFDFLIHVLVLYYLIVGVINGHRLKQLSSEKLSELYKLYKPKSPYGLDNSAEQYNESPLRPADIAVKARILLQGHFAGHQVCYRRVKRVNELVIDGFVYDEIEMLVETPHQLNAVVGEHNISAGFAGVHSFIAVDGEKVAKKLRIA